MLIISQRKLRLTELNKNLKVAGRILSTNNGGSIIQNVQSTGTTIVNCQSSVIFESTANPGGLVGHEHASTNQAPTNLIIKNSLFDGFFNTTNTIAVAIIAPK